MVGRIDDILFACEHVLHWIYGVCLCFQITCCGCQIKVDTLLSLALPYRRKPDAKKNKKGMERHAERKTAFVQRVIYGYFLILIKETNVCHRCCVIIEVETASIINFYATKSIIVKNDSLEYTPKMNISLINPFALFWQS